MCRVSTWVFPVKSLTILLLIFLSTSAYCQVTVLEKSVYLLDDIYSLSVQKKEGTEGSNSVDYYIIKSKQGEKESKGIELRSLEKEVFKAALKKAFLEVTNTIYLTNGEIKTDYKDKFNSDFEKIEGATYPEILVSAIRVAEYEPIAGEIYIHDKIPANTSINRSPTEYNNYKIKKLPLIIDKVVNFNGLLTGLGERYKSLEKFKNYISSLESDLNKLETEIKGLPMFDVSVTTRISAENALNGHIKTFNNKIANKNNIAFDNNIFYTLSYPEVALNPLTYKSKTKLEKAQENRREAIQVLNSAINDKIKLLDFSKDDIEHLQKSIYDHRTNIEVENESYTDLGKKIRIKKDSLEGSFTPPLTRTVKGKLEHNISVLELEQRQLTIKINSLITALNPEFSRSLNRNLDVTEVEIEFNEGFIENITVRGHLGKDPNRNDNAPLEFTNNYPIGFSSKKDFDNLSDVKLFEKRNRSSLKNLHIIVDNIFDYNYNLDLNTKDYSPQNGIIPFKMGQKTHLTKIQSSKILEAKIFTDLVGIDSDKPNGLIQTEISRRFNMHSKRWGFFNEQVANWGSFAFIEPTVIISKIEQDNRRLPLNNNKSIVNGKIYDRSSVPLLQLREFQHLSVGTDLNLLIFDFPNIKSAIMFNGGFRFGRTALLDTTYRVSDGIIVANDVVDRIGVSTLEFYPEITYKIQPERRYGFNFSYRPSWFRLLNSDVMQVTKGVDYNSSDITNKSSMFSNFEILGYLDPNKTQNGRLFFRYRFFHALNNSNTNFYQAQFGYSFFLLSKNQPKSSIVN